MGRLTRILAIWQRREDAALLELQQKVRRTAESRVRAAAIDDARATASLRAARALESTDARHEEGWHRNWITELTVRFNAATSETTQCVVIENAARAVWQRARRDRRTIERLSERAERRQALEGARLERREMDELAARSAARKDAERW